ncbi:DsbA family protein [Halovenus marina]|uniref:DsbA family protein n=1 Tax=Halovenus marina TaxID=3396621 RepID=UPI003F544D21
MTQRTTRWTRRRVLVGTAAAGVTALAGCLGGDDSDGDGNGDDSANGDEDGSADGSDLLDQFSDVPEGDFARPVRGDPEAEVTLEVYKDFACPHCRTYVMEDAERITSEFVTSDQIRYEARSLPLPVADPESFEAANAARAAFEEGGNSHFWAYSHRLFEEQDRLTEDAPDIYGELATELGLDGDTIQSAGANQTYSDTVTADRNRAQQLRIGGTPGFALNGEVVSGGISDVMSAIESALGE